MTGQLASLDEDLTGRENLVLIARLWGFAWRDGRRRADALLAAFDLSEAAGRQVKDYSGGMRRRLDIAASLIVTPGVLFLDEPTTGLDPTARQEVWRIVRTLAQAGVTILLTTQYLDKADQLADRIAVSSGPTSARPAILVSMRLSPLSMAVRAATCSRDTTPISPSSTARRSQHCTNRSGTLRSGMRGSVSCVG